MKALRIEPGDPPEVASAKCEALIQGIIQRKYRRQPEETRPDFYDTMRARAEHAARGFDPGRGTKLATWVYRCIKLGIANKARDDEKHARLNADIARRRERREMEKQELSLELAGLAADVSDALAKIPHRARRKAVKTWLKCGCDQAAAARLLGVHRSSVQQHVEAALPLLREALAAYAPAKDD